MSGTKKKPEEKTVRFQLKGIELLDFSFNHPKQKIPQQMVFSFDIKLEHKIPTENKIIAVVVTVDIREENKTEIIASIMASCVYEVPDIVDYIDKTRNIPHFPEPFLTALNSITVSTVRGIMFSQCRGTFLHNAVLPVIDPKTFVTQK